MKGSPENNAFLRRRPVVRDARPYGRLASLKGRRDAPRQGAHDESGPALTAARIRLKKISLRRRLRNPRSGATMQARY
jgi:hypothetical protein